VTGFPLPDLEFEPIRPYYAAAARGELAIPRCRDCNAWNWVPPERCRSCGSGSLAWVATRGIGTLFSWAVVERAWVKEFAHLAPYATGLVALDEDPAVRIVSLIVDCDPHGLRIDMPMRAVFRPLPFPDAGAEVPAPLFTPAT
jgi:uncharacterized OB-fold protein